MDTALAADVCGSVAEAIVTVDACLVALPRPGQTAAQRADEQAWLEALKTALEAA